MFGTLRRLLETKDDRCELQATVGGRCWRCLLYHLKGDDASHGRVAGVIDGSRPVCLDLLSTHNCTVLSFGINNDFSFDLAMEDLGCTVHAFDPTMGVGDFRKSSGVFFHNMGIGVEDQIHRQTPVASLGTLVRQLGLQGGGVIDYVKLDVESSEWGVLEQQLRERGDLLRVRQLAIEFHLISWRPIIGMGKAGLTNVSRDISDDNVMRFVGVLTALKAGGFALVYSKPYLASVTFVGGRLSYIYETGWVNKNIL